MTSIDTSPTTAKRMCRAIELLAPARNLQCGIDAIRHGADAVYIGGPGYGARSAAGNSVDDIRELCDYAHLFNARVYVTINTIVYDHELDNVRRMAWLLHDAGADAFIVQDVALRAMGDMPPVPLHASTQMDNRTVEQVRWLASQGYAQTVLARELTLTQIREIHKAVPQMPLEAFVHGAVCVSLSGRCYASQHLMGRSANRGECAQICRLPFDLVDADRRLLAQGKHLLSLCDMNRSDYLEQMMDAGICSFKIEGRLKDAGYVKNITAHYRSLIDAILERRSLDYCRSSRGTCTYSFTPAPEKSFNRGFTDYFLNNRPAAASPLTPKMMGPEVGKVAAVRRDHIIIVPAPARSAIVSGDGLCFIDGHDTLQGFRVNRAEGNCLYLRPMPQGLKKDIMLHRNHDQAFETSLQGNTADRRIDIGIAYEKTATGFAISCDGTRLEFEYPHEPAHAPQDGNIARQLSRLGDTAYRATVTVKSGGDCFVPSSLLAQWKRQTIEALAARRNATTPECDNHAAPPPAAPAISSDGAEGTAMQGRNANVANKVAAGCLNTDINAYELHPTPAMPLMTCRHCVRRLMGLCGKTIHQPWHLVMSDGRRLRLDFDCQQCTMRVYADT